MSSMKIDYVRLVPDNLEIPEFLYKYRTLDRNSIANLVCNQAYFSKPEDFNDPYEPAKLFDSGMIGYIFQDELRRSGIYCLSDNPNELLMWSYYAAALHGFVVGYRTEELLRSLRPHNRDDVLKYFYKVDYDTNMPSKINTVDLSNLNPTHSDPQRIRAYSSKAKGFKHESEYRIVIEPHSKDTNFGFGLHSHSPNAIERIIFGEFTSKDDEAIIRQVLAGRNIKFYRARIIPAEYRIAAHECDGIELLV